MRSSPSPTLAARAEAATPNADEAIVGAALLVAADVSMWLTLAFPAWVLTVSVLILVRSGFIEDQRANEAGVAA